MLFERYLQLPDLLTKKSIFLFGPRATGKTFLIEHQLQDSLIINLLHGETFMKLNQNASMLENIILTVPTGTIVVIDEVQRIPDLLNEVHRLIERDHTKFLLTSGKMLNCSSLASDTGVSAVTIRAYYQLLEETFLGFMVPA